MGQQSAAAVTRLLTLTDERRRMTTDQYARGKCQRTSTRGRAPGISLALRARDPFRNPCPPTQAPSTRAKEFASSSADNEYARARANFRAPRAPRAPRARARGVTKLAGFRAKVEAVDQYARGASCLCSDFAHARARHDRNCLDLAPGTTLGISAGCARARLLGKFAVVGAIGTYVGTQVGTAIL